MKILIYGGAFNPIHRAHLNNIILANEMLKPDKIIIVPNKYLHFKDDNELCSYEHRIKMINIALNDVCLIGIPIELSLIEFSKPSKLYSFDLINELKEEYPKDEFYFLVGSDQVNNFNKWYRLNELKKMVKFVVVTRDDTLISSEYLKLNNPIMMYRSTDIRRYYKSSGLEYIDHYLRKEGLYLKLVLRNYLDERRIKHCENVAKLSCEIAQLNNLDYKKAYVCGMLHDIAKQLPIDKQYALLDIDRHYFELNNATVHAYAGAILINNELNINDEVIKSAIAKHTTGAYEMSSIDKLIYTCDMLSSERDFAGISQLRELLYSDLNECFRACFKASFNHLLDKNIEISNDLKTLLLKIERSEV